MIEEGWSKFKIGSCWEISASEYNAAYTAFQVVAELPHEIRQIYINSYSGQVDVWASVKLYFDEAESAVPFSETKFNMLWSILGSSRRYIP